MNYRAAPQNAPLLVVSTQVIALDRTTGQARWKYELDGAIARRFALDGDRLFVFDSEAKLHCIEVETGKEVGKVALEMRNANSMLLDGEHLYVSSDDSVAALDCNGRVLWETQVPSNRSFSLCGLAVPGGNMMQIDFSTSS